MKNKLLQVGMAVLMAVSFGLTAVQLTVNAQSSPLCHGLSCTAQEDCGSKCFCNRPSGSCIADQLILD